MAMADGGRRRGRAIRRPLSAYALPNVKHIFHYVFWVWNGSGESVGDREVSIILTRAICSDVIKDLFGCAARAARLTDVPFKHTRRKRTHTSTHTEPVINKARMLWTGVCK